MESLLLKSASEQDDVTLRSANIVESWNGVCCFSNAVSRGSAGMRNPRDQSGACVVTPPAMMSLPLTSATPLAGVANDACYM